MLLFFVSLNKEKTFRSELDNEDRRRAWRDKNKNNKSSVINLWHKERKFKLYSEQRGWVAWPQIVPFRSQQAAECIGNRDD